MVKVEHITFKRRHKQSSILEMVLAEGRNREIRRMLASVGHKVQRLTRTAIGPLRLGTLPVGSHRVLKPGEIKALRDLAFGGGVSRGKTKTTKKSGPREATPTKRVFKKSDATKTDSSGPNAREAPRETPS